MTIDLKKLTNLDGKKSYMGVWSLVALQYLSGKYVFMGADSTTGYDWNWLTPIAVGLLATGLIHKWVKAKK